jgi:CheY-like chemotaxis protein
VAADVAPGRGVTISIFLPRHLAPEEPAEEPEPPAAGARMGGSETVLLAEDEESVRKLVCRVLQAQGYRVLAAASGPEALELAAKHDGPIPLLLTDVVMPGMSGPVLAETITASRPDVRVLFMSGYADDHLPALGLDTDLILKPFAPAELLRRTRAALDDAAGPTPASVANPRIHRVSQAT